YRCRLIPRSESTSPNQSFLAHSGAHAVGGDRHLLYARTWIRHPLCRTRCGAGIGLHPHRLALSVLWHIPWLAWSRAHWQRHIIERAFRKFAANHVAATRNRSPLQRQLPSKWVMKGLFFAL